jgi:hypothetical protein
MARPMADQIPKKATWIKEKASGFDPENNTGQETENDKINKK